MFGGLPKDVISLCEKVSLPKSLRYIENCSLVCSNSFQQYIINTKRDDVALCVDNNTAVTCTTNADCRKYHLGASCKKLPCLCKGQSGSHLLHGLSADDAEHLKIPSLDTCVVSNKWMSPELPLVPFPWGTLLVVFAIVASFVVCLLAVRWISPIIRRMQAKTTTTSRNRRTSSSAAEEGTLFAPIPLQENVLLPSFLPHRNPRICITNPRTHIIRATHRRLMHDRAMHNDAAASGNACALVPDKPPPYELAIQEGPPSYDELEREPLNSVRVVEESIRRSSEAEHDSHLRPIPSAASISTI